MDKNLKLHLIFQAAGNVRTFLGGVRADTDKTGKALVEARQRVQALSRAAKDISGFRKLETALSGTRTELVEAKAEAQRLGHAMDAVERPTKQMARAFDLAKTKVQALERQQDGQVRGLADLENKLRSAGVSTDALGAHELRLTRDLKGANAELRTQSRRMEDVADRQRRMGAARSQYDRTQRTAGNIRGAGMSAVGVGVGIAAPLVASVSAANDLEARMTTIAQRSNMSAEATTTFERSLLGAGRAANRTRDETLSMFDQLTAQGFDSNDALAMAPSIGRASTAYQISDEDLSATAGSLRNVGLAANQTGDAFDIMAVAGKKGNFEFDAMAKFFPSLTAGAAAYGMTGLKAVAELAAAAQIARRGAGSDEEAANNLNNILQKIGSPQTERKFAALGINLREGLAAGEAAGKSALETIVELTRQATGGDASKIGLIFEDTQVQKGMRPLMANMEEFRQLRDEALGAHGEVDADFRRRMLDNAQAIKKMRIDAGDAAVQIGKDLMPSLIGLAGAADKVLVKYNKWSKAHPGLAKGLATTAGIIAAVAIAGGALAIVISAILGPWALMRFALAGAGVMFAPMAAGFVSAATATWGFTAALLANPVTWIVLGIVAAVALLAGGAYLIYKNWGAISAWFGNLWTTIKDGALAGIRGLVSAFMNFTPAGHLITALGAIWPALQGLWPKFKESGGHLLKGIIDGVVGGVPALIRAVMSAGGSLITAFKHKLGIKSPSRVFAQLGDYTMQGMGQGIARSAGDPLRRMRGVAGALTAAGAVAASGVAFAAGVPPSADRPSLDFQSGPRLNTSPGAAAAASGRAAGGAPTVTIGSVTIQITQQPGQDASALAREVARILQSPNLGAYADDHDSYGEAD